MRTTGSRCEARTGRLLSTAIAVALGVTADESAHRAFLRSCAFDGEPGVGDPSMLLLVGEDVRPSDSASSLPEEESDEVVRKREAPAEGAPPVRELGIVVRRCPYCHAEVAQRDATLVCRGCLAPHHSDCWRELRRCSACGSEAALAPAPAWERVQRPTTPTRAAGSETNRSSVLLMVGVIALTLLAAVGLRHVSRTPPEEERSSAPGPKVATPTEPLAPRVVRVPVTTERPPVSETQTIDPPPLPDEATLVPIDGPSDSTYVEEIPGQLLGGPIAQPETWQRVGPIAATEAWRRGGDVVVGLRVLAGDACRVVALDGTTVVIFDARREAPRRIEMKNNLGAHALSGNRLLAIHEDELIAFDLDQAQLLPTRHAAPETVGLADCVDDPRRVYCISDGLFRVFDAGTLSAVRTTKLEYAPGKPIKLGQRIQTDGRGRWIYGHTTLVDAARGFEQVTSVDGPGPLQPDPGGRLVFMNGAVLRAGTLERVGGPVGKLLGRLSDGTLLTATRGRKAGQDDFKLTSVDPVTGRAGESRSVGPAEPILLRGCDRAARVRNGWLEVRDVPPPTAARLGKVVALLRFPSNRASPTLEWTYTPQVAEAEGAEVRVEGPQGLTWDGRTARWRPSLDQLGDQSVTVTVRAPGRQPLVATERVKVVLQQLPIETAGKLEVLPSGRFIALTTDSGRLTVIEPTTWRTHKSTVRPRAWTEVGDSLWVQPEGDEGALLETSLPELVTKSMIRLDGPVADLATDGAGRLTWARTELHHVLRVGRLHAAERTWEVFEATAPRAPVKELWWLPDERFGVATQLVAAGFFWRWGGGEPPTSPAGGTQAPVAVLPDGGSIVADRLLRPDGSTLRHLPEGSGPRPSHDGRYCSAVEHVVDQGVRVPRIVFYSLSTGELLGTLPCSAALQSDVLQVFPLSRFNLLIAPLGNKLTLIPYDPSSWH